MENGVEDFKKSGSDYVLCVSLGDEYAQISATGKANSGSMMALFSEISRICRFKHKNRILCELKFKGFETFQDLMILRANILTCDIPANVRIAIVSYEKNHWAFHELGTNFFQISGSWTRVFETVHAAQSWLQSDTHTNEPGFTDSPPH